VLFSAVVSVVVLRPATMQDPPYGAKVEFVPEDPDAGWSSPLLTPWLEAGVKEVLCTFPLKFQRRALV